MIVKIIKNPENKLEKMQESTSKDLEKLNNTHTKANNTITEIKNTLEDINSRISEAQEEISQPEDKMVEITSKEQNKLKRIKTEDSLRNIWDNIKQNNIQIIGVIEEEKKKRYEKIFEEITVENFPNIEKEIVNKVQEAQSVPYRINPRRNTPRHILVKLTENKHKERERILKTTGKSNKYHTRETSPV